MAIVYQHKTLDTNEIFYIGIGINKKRAFELKNNRTKFHKNVRKKHGIIIEILYENIEWEEACRIEKELIKEYGRRDTKTGNLVNLTDGGEGSFGRNLSDESKTKMRIKATGRIVSDETRIKLGLSHKGKSHPMSDETKRKLSEQLIGKSFVDRFGKEHAEEIKKKIREKVIGQKRPKQSLALTGRYIGELNPMYGKHQSEEFKQKKREYFLSDKNPGKNKSEETKRKISESKMGIPSPLKGIPRKRIVCPYCSKEGGEGLMQRWHFNNCKFKSA